MSLTLSHFPFILSFSLCLTFALRDVFSAGSPLAANALISVVVVVVVAVFVVFVVAVVVVFVVVVVVIVVVVVVIGARDAGELAFARLIEPAGARLTRADSLFKECSRWTRH